VKLFGRRRARALAAGTVAPADVFVEDGSSTDAFEAAEAPADLTSPTPTAVIDTGRDGTAADGPPITAPVPVVAGAAPEAGAAGAAPAADAGPTLRFGFDDAHAAPGDGAAVSLRPAGSPAGTPADTPVGTPTGPAGQGGTATALATAPRVISIGFGEELDEIETTTADPSPVDAGRPEVDPRLRARRIQVRRDQGRKRLRWAVVGGVAAAVLIGAALVLESPLFAVNDVQVTGAAYTDPARLQQVVDDLEGASLLGADLGKAEATLAADPWVKRVRVERRPLRGVRIEIVERAPVATYMGTDQRWRVLDGDGRIIAVLDPPGSKPVVPLPLTLASSGPDLEAGATAPASLAGAASIVPRLPNDLRAKTCSLGVDEGGRLDLTLCDGFVIDLGAPERLRDKLVTTMFVLNTDPRVADATGLDVGDPEHAVLIQK
jgi:cell division protein FtsQ